MATAHLICGSTGAGKSTYARRLALEQHALLFTLDEWMAEFFWVDQPKVQDLDRALEWVRRCEAQIWRLAQQTVLLGHDIVLDCGYLRREHRQRAVGEAQRIGAAPHIHFVTAEVAVRRARVHQRNTQKTETFYLQVDDGTFDWCETYFEPPSEEELRLGRTVHTD